MAQKRQLQLHKQSPEDLFLLSGYNYNYMNNPHAISLSNAFVDHGAQPGFWEHLVDLS